MPASTCTFPNDRGHELSARLEEPDGPVRGAAVFAHCFTCSKDLRAARRLTLALARHGIAVLSFDFTGLGSSDGEFAASTFSSDVDDLVAAAHYLADTVSTPTLLVGHSLGGAAVLSAAARLPDVVAVATIGAPADVEHVAGLLADDLPTIREEGEARVTIAGRTFTVRDTFLDDLGGHRLLDTVADLDAALLLLHGPLDNVVGIDNARRLFGAARHPKSFVSLDEADHLLSRSQDASYAADVISAWASRYLSGADDTTDATSGYDDRTIVATNHGGLATHVAARGFDLAVDEPRSAGGTETGPTPYDHLAGALAACTSMTVRMYADRKDLPLDEVRTTVRFDRVHADDCAACESEDGRIELFTRTVELRGDLTDEQRERMWTIANRCPVHRTLEGQIEVHTPRPE